LEKSIIVALAISAMKGCKLPHPNNFLVKMERFLGDHRDSSTEIGSNIQIGPEENCSRQYPADRPPLISVIIPTLNEEASISAVLESIARSDEVEIIVVDGGSEDNTVESAGLFGATVMVSEAGRGRQMNFGAARASGKVLLFLHADTILPNGWIDHVLGSLNRPGVIAGAFEFGTDGRGWQIKLIEKLANFRAKKWQLPYGDQGIFLTTEVFLRLGGFPEMPIMEDFELLRRLKRHGRIHIAPTAVMTSARRWDNLGVWRVTLINQVIIAGYLLGVSPRTLSKFYRAGGQSSS
jgi:rSAM/selenodomain-associated transferase 2